MLNVFDNIINKLLIPWKALLAYIIIPLIPFIINRFYEYYNINIRPRPRLEFRQEIVKYINNYSLIIFISNFILFLILSANNAIYGYSKLTIAIDINYYTGVNSPEFDSIKSIYLGLGDHSFLKYYYMYERNKRKLSNTDSITLIYHTKNYDNLLIQQRLKELCFIENNLLSSFHSKVISVESIFVNTNCIYENINIKDNLLFLQDDINNKNIQSSIIISKIRTESSSSSHFLRSIINKIYHEFKVTISDNDYNQLEFVDAIINAVRLTIIAFISCYAYLVVIFRGFFFPFIFIVSIILSLITAIGFVPIFRYQYFSAFNLMGVYVLMCVGGTTVIQFVTSWRNKIKIYEKSNEKLLLVSYLEIGEASLFTCCATILSLFSKLASPVYVINQLGLFVGFSYLIFYIQFHYILIPCWVGLSKISCIKRRSGIDIQSLDAGSIDDNIQSTNTDNIDNISEFEFFTIPYDRDHINVEATDFENHSKDSFEDLEETKVDNVSINVSDPVERKSKIIKVIGFISFCLVLLCIYISFHFLNSRLEVDFDIPQIFAVSSNLGQLFYIMKTYKATVAPSASSTPTFQPTSPTMLPTFKPTVKNKPTRLPTFQPTLTPTIYPTLTPTTQTKPIVSSSSTMMKYQIYGCFG